jgi:hypothetical protein
MDEHAYRWLPKAIGHDRWTYYVRLARGDLQRAVQLYLHDVRLRDALRAELEHLEMALRSSYHAAMMERRVGQPLWLTDPALPVRGLLQRWYGRLVSDLEAGRLQVGQALGKLSFTFWLQLTDRAFQTKVWVPYLRHVFAAGSDRARIHKVVADAVWLRNRVHHYNPVIELDLVRHLDDMLWLLEQVCPELAKQRREQTVLPQLVATLNTTESRNADD